MYFQGSTLSRVKLMQWKVTITKQAVADLRTLPRNIKDKFFIWVELVEQYGLDVVRQNKGFHDEPLKGQRKGQRSIRLNRSYRAIYTLSAEGQLKLVCVEEVNKHEY